MILVKNARGLAPDLLTDELAKRFWSYIDVREDDKCWPWNGPLDKKGYGRFNVKTNRYLPHRIAYLIKTKEKIEPGYVVRHSCHNPRCCNPKHLQIGCQQDNINDMMVAERYENEEDCHLSKLTGNDVVKIRKLYALKDLGIDQLASDFNVHLETIRRVITIETWKRSNYLEYSQEALKRYEFEKGSGRHRKITDGVNIFDSLIDAANFHGLSDGGVVNRRIKSKTKRFARWKYIDI